MSDHWLTPAVYAATTSPVAKYAAADSVETNDWIPAADAAVAVACVPPAVIAAIVATSVALRYERVMLSSMMDANDGSERSCNSTDQR